MEKGRRTRQALALAALVVALVVVLATTGPRPSTEVSGVVRRLGGVCLELEQWSLFGWKVVGQAITVDDISNGLWYPPVDDPLCAPVPQQIYQIRLPFDAPGGVYRMCGLADSEPCVEFRRVPFEGTPGP